jgi:hypothetical protein
MGQVYAVPATDVADATAGDACAFFPTSTFSPKYCIGLASNFALHLGPQKKNVCPMWAERWKDWSVTVIPHTGSFSVAVLSLPMDSDG